MTLPDESAAENSSRRRLLALFRLYIENELMLPPAAPARAETVPGPAVPGEASAELVAVEACWAGCTRCSLHLKRNRIVPGAGAPKARLVIIGEAPGAEEDVQGLPFVGRSGELLTRMLTAIGLGRNEVYITNVVKCRPPGNRDPLPDELATCRPFLAAQIAAIRPLLILALGKFAARTLMNCDEKTSMTRLRGSEASYEGIPCIATFHPAYLLRNPAAKKEAWEDLKRVRKRLGELTGGADA